MPSKPKPKPNPVGRPKLAQGKAKGNLIAVRFTDEEMTTISVAARLCGQTRSEWIRDRIRKGIRG